MSHSSPVSVSHDIKCAYRAFAFHFHYRAGDSGQRQSTLHIEDRGAGSLTKRQRTRHRRQRLEFDLLCPAAVFFLEYS